MNFGLLDRPQGFCASSEHVPILYLELSAGGPPLQYIPRGTCERRKLPCRFGVKAISPSAPPCRPQGYNGHTFWDQDMWMSPGILLLYPDLAQSLMTYRLNRLEGASV